MEKQRVRAGASWRLLCDGASSAAWNMAADEAMLLSHAAGDNLPTLRFYSWQPAAVSLGYFQRADAEIDRAACLKQGIGMVRRLTGGRAVLHDMEVTYSLVVREDELYIPRGVTASYLFFSGGIVAGLDRLGIDAQMQAPENAGARATGRLIRSAACFDAPSHYELTVKGRKIVGSAQFRHNGVLLQHGSILLRFCPERMTNVMRLDDEAERAAMTAELSRRATDLSEVAGRQVEFAEVVEAVQAGIAEKCGLEFVPGEWSSKETVLIHELATNKYSADEWNMRR